MSRWEPLRTSILYRMSRMKQALIVSKEQQEEKDKELELIKYIESNFMRISTKYSNSNSMKIATLVYQQLFTNTRNISNNNSSNFTMSITKNTTVNVQNVDSNNSSSLTTIKLVIPINETTSTSGQQVTNHVYLFTLRHLTGCHNYREDCDENLINCIALYYSTDASGVNDSQSTCLSQVIPVFTHWYYRGESDSDGNEVNVNLLKLIAKQLTSSTIVNWQWHHVGNLIMAMGTSGGESFTRLFDISGSNDDDDDKNDDNEEDHSSDRTYRVNNAVLLPREQLAIIMNQRKNNNGNNSSTKDDEDDDQQQ